MLKELVALVDSGTIRVIDMLIVTKDDDGGIYVVELDDLDDLGELQAIETGSSRRTWRAAIIYQHASDDRERVIADTIGAAIDEWHDRQGDEADGTTGVLVPV